MNELQRAMRRINLWPIRHYRDIEGWLTGNEALALFRVARGLGPAARVLEIGSWKGKSTYCIARGLRGGVVYALDPFNAAGETGNGYDRVRGERPLVEQFRNNLSRYDAIRRVEIRQGYSQDFAGAFTGLDFLFIDGDHSIEGCRYDFETFGPAVKPGGWLAFHDYYPDRAELGPTWVVDRLVTESGAWRREGRHDSLVLFRAAAA